MMEMVSEYPQLAAIHDAGVVATDHASALQVAFELLHGPVPEAPRIPPNQVQERDK
jgi:hypothetical protein